MMMMMMMGEMFYLFVCAAGGVMGAEEGGRDGRLVERGSWPVTPPPPSHEKERVHDGNEQAEGVTRHAGPWARATPPFHSH